MMPERNAFSWSFASRRLLAFAALNFLVIPIAVCMENCNNPPVSGKIYSIINKGSGQALDVSGESRSYGANMIQWPNKASGNQRFLLTDTGNGHWNIQAYHSGLVVDVEGASVANGSNILQWGYHGGDNQQWILKQESDGAYNIVSSLSGNSISVANNDAGSNVYQQRDESNPHQRWYLNPVDGSCSNNNSIPAPIPGNCTGGNTLSVGDSFRSVIADGRQRSYYLHVPKSYSGRSGVPLIIDYHGYGGNGEGEKIGLVLTSSLRLADLSLPIQMGLAVHGITECRLSVERMI